LTNPTSNPALIAAGIGVGETATGVEHEEVLALEGDLGAVFTGDVGTEPAVELITDTDAEQHPAVEAMAKLVPHRGGRQRVVRIDVQLAVGGVGHADVAAQIPAAEILHRGRRISHRRRRHDGRHVGCKRGRRQQGCRACGYQELNATHWLRPFAQ
jgi:hypothetical protein